MLGYGRDTVEDWDEYEEDGEEQHEQEAQEDESEEEEDDPKPTREELEYLEKRQKMKEAIRKKMKKESGSALNNSRERKNKLPYDNFGSFFGPSKPVIAQRVIEESKSLLENKHLAARISSSHHSNKKSSTSNSAGSKNGLCDHPPKVVNQVKTKVQKLKDTRDYSFLLDDDAELPAPTKGAPPRNVSLPKSDARSIKVPQKSKQLSNNAGRQILNGQERKSEPMNGKMQHKSGSHKITPASKPNLTPLDSRKQLGSNYGNGPGRPVGPKGLPSKAPVTNVEKKISAPALKSSALPGKSSMQGQHKSLDSRSNTHTQKKPLQQKREIQEPSNGKMMPKQLVASSKAQMNKPVKQILPRPSLQEHRPKKKPVRRYSDDEDDDGRAISMIRQMFRYNPNRYADNDDDSDMEANFEDIMKEERRSAKIAREEDEIELRKIEEEERRERLRKEAKKRKLSQR